MKRIVLAALLLTACSSGGGHHNSGGSTSPPSNTQSSWTIGPYANGKNYSEGMPARPTMQGAGWTFNFPSSGGVDAVIKKPAPALHGSVTMHFVVTGGGFKPSGDSSGVPASVGVSFQRKGDNWSGSGSYASYRWYSNARVTLKEGEYTLTAPMSVAQWHNVQGQGIDSAGFASAISNLDNVSVVFGGQFSSHGVYATQPSTFTMVSLQVIP